MAETEAAASAAAAAPAPEAPPKFEYPKHPYEKPVMDSINKFFRSRSKKPANFVYTADGNLEVKDPAGTIQLKRFLPLEPSERAALEELRLDTLADLETQYETERAALVSAWEEYRSTGAMRPVLAANQRVADLDARRNAVRSAVRNIVPIENPKTNEILLAQRYEERKLLEIRDPFDKEVVRLSFYDFMPEFDQGKYVVDQEVAEAEAAAAEEAAGGEPSEMAFRQTLKDGRKARVFFDTDSAVNGFLSPMWAMKFTMDDTEYSSALQAYEAERARELGMNDLRESILKTRSGRTIRLITRKVTNHPADAKGLWLKIYTNIYQQPAGPKAQLLATGTDALVFADLREGPSGIGLAEKDSGVLDPTKWKGENAVGLALETVRTQLREGAMEEAPANSAPKEASITEEQQAKARVGAIVNNARRNRA
jgi:predicted NAD-dependent protein-ADP-ribosyltransferase YbiA (DUF1768 family)